MILMVVEWTVNVLADLMVTRIVTGTPNIKFFHAYNDL